MAEGRQPPILGTVPPRLPGVPVRPPAPPGPPPLSSARRLTDAVARFGRGTGHPSLLTPSELDRFKNLLVFARMTVEGYFTGRHRSPYHGSSVEFADYREYVPGDDASRIDWRVYGRSRRLFVRHYEEETDMAVYLLVDVSASMRYAGRGRQSKYLLAAKVAAALAYLMTHQGDKAALVLFAESLIRFLPPGGTRRHLHNLVSELERVRPASTTGMVRALGECSPLFKKRGLIVLLSDFWTDHDGFFEALGPFLHRKFTILLLQVVDPDELELPAVNSVRFQDMETAERVHVEPEEIRAAYRQTVREHIRRLARGADDRQVSHALVSTGRPYIDAIEAYLGFRGKHAFVSD